VNVWYHVGSKNEKKSKTGFAICSSILCSTALSTITRITSGHREAWRHRSERHHE
jgi:hypothetical protein